MKITIIGIAAIFVMMAFIAKTTIQFKPLKISFEQPYLLAGWVFMILAVFCFQINGEKKAIREIHEEIERVKNESKDLIA